MKVELTIEELKQLVKITPVGATTDVTLKLRKWSYFPFGKSRLTTSKTLG